ncbi:hypothetical protein TOI97_06440 [Denitrificimonas sp. JX-1]|uniref:Helicase/UvrB N-terminal domain-containing protein n=1 Tax=Denitrificimonas halotolerans TaxID=3098930 RepID=A0ABU5GR68_9GAMM|nr:DEAD/DEAH box helicase family protein [Denitrificimonas sp. JX-1]MDY7219205.1 hypothetical protein [Denitrificimonas sp. JX-1]
MLMNGLGDMTAPPKDSKAARKFLHIRNAFTQLLKDPRSSVLTAARVDRYSARRQKRIPLLQSLTNFVNEPYAPSPNSVQTEALQALVNTRFDDFSRGLVVLATGMGKT